MMINVTAPITQSVLNHSFEMNLAVVIFLIIGATGSPIESPDYDAIVVGMGASGSMCAATLARAGKRVLALEAMDRVGGRVNTVPFGDGVIELGAEWIHGTEGSPSYELAMQNNVSILPDRSDFKMYRSDGSEADTDVIRDMLDFCLGVINEPPKDPEPLGQYITKRFREYIQTKYPQLVNDTDFTDNFLRFMDEVINGYESSNSWNDVTTESDYVELGGNQQMSWHTNGYKTLFDIILNKYNSGPGLPSLTTKLSTEVVQIKWPKDGTGLVEVTTRDGAVYRAPHVVVTVSVGVLKERHSTLFSPPLPATKTTAIDNISIGVVGKITFRFPANWCGATFCGFLWRGAERDAVPPAQSWLTRLDGVSVPMSCHTCGTLWLAGDSAKLMETLPEDEVRSKVMGVIRRFMGANVTVLEPIEMIRSSWFSNPFTRGSYSYDNALSHNYPNARKDLGQPLLDAGGIARVLFAGEATEPTHFSTVHGALESGRREALRILHPATPASKL